MTLDDNGDVDVVTASCGCEAGVRPHGSCKHLAALCYALEAYCRVVEKRLGYKIHVHLIRKCGIVPVNAASTTRD